jgi:hypothetical protein
MIFIQNKIDSLIDCISIIKALHTEGLKLHHNDPLQQLLLYACIQTYSASARISKGQGYQGFSRKRAWSSFGQKREICVVQGKTFKK